MARKPVAKNDLTWLLMDRPNNLMYVHSLVWLKDPPDWDAVKANLKERVVDRYPVFRRRAIKDGGVWYWEDVEDFDIEGQIRRATLPSPGGRAEASAYVSERMSQPLDFGQPLWEVDFLDGAEGIDDTGEGGLILSRYHHGLADGIRLVQVLLSQLDPLVEGKMPQAVGRKGRARRGPIEQGASLAKSTARGSHDFLGGLGRATLHAPRHLSSASPRHMARAADRLRSPSWVIDRVSEVASDENALVNNLRSVGRLTLAGSSVDTVWSGTVGVAKKVTWIAGVSLTDLRSVGRHFGASLNDVILAGISLGITDYLADKGVREVDQVSWLIPVSLKPFTPEAEEELGNHFAVVNLPMPLGESDPAALLAKIHSRMNRIKNSAEPMVLYGVQRVMAETPPAVSVRLTNLVANKSVGIITNVPGPPTPMALAGNEVTAILGFVPLSGDQPLGLCIFSFNGRVNIGIASDAGLMPDPELVAEFVEKGIQRLIASAQG